MSKAVEGAVLLGLAGAALAAATGGLGVALETLAWSSISTTVGAMGALAIGGVSMEAGAIGDALTSNRGMNITTRQAAACRQIIYGQQRVGGVMIYKSTTGSSHDQFNYVIVLAGHECDSIQNLYLDGRQVHWQVGSGGNTTRNGVNFGGIADAGTYTGPNGVQYNFGGAGHSGLYCEARYGDQLPGDVIGALTANDPNWAADGLGNSPWVAGCTYVYLKLEYNTNLFPGEPEIRFTVNGKNNIWDPRTSARGFTQNWALICADVITDPVFGLGDDSVNQLQLIAAANVCDEQVPLAIAPGTLTESRYTTNYHYDTSTGPGDVLSTMMAGAAGRMSRIGGEWYLWPAYWQGPSFTFDEQHVTSSIQWKPNRSARDLVNRVNGTYIAATYPYNILGNLYDSNGFYDGMIQNNFPFAFQPTNFPQYAADVLHGYASDEFLAADGGRQLPRELNLTTVLSVTQAQRVAKIGLLRNRQQGSGTFDMSMAAFSMQPTDVMQLSFPAHGWTEKTLEVTGVSFRVENDDKGTPSIKCGVSVAETDPSVYEWSVSEELTVYDVPTTPTQTPYNPAPPTGMTLTSGASTALVGLDGVVQPRVEVQWTTPQDVLTKQVQVQYAPVVGGVAGNWISYTLVDVALNTCFVSGVVSGGTYNFRIRSVRANGAFSAWEEIDGFVVSTVLSVVTQVALAPGTLSSIGNSDGTADIIVSPFTALIGMASVAVLPAGPFDITGLNQSQLYWVYYVDPTFIGGAITPIATQNQSDFLNKVGYFLIDSIVTQVYSSGGGVGLRYAPTAFIDSGAVSTLSPTAAYDNDVTTSATVTGVTRIRPSGLGHTVVVPSNGQCTWSGFASYVLTVAAVLNVTCSFTDGGSGIFIPCEVHAVVGGVDTMMANPSVVTASATYTLSLPIGTDLSTVTVYGLVNATTYGSTTHNSAGSIVISEIYVQ